MSENLPAVPPRNVEVSKLAEQFPILDAANNDDLRQTIDANVGPRGLTERDLSRIKVPSGGQLAWMVPSLDGEEPARELTGIIIAWRDTRVYYKTPYDQRGKKSGPPDCSSKDGFWGTGDPGGDCERCPFSQWESDPKGGRGQACKEVRQLLFLRDGQYLPDLINIPPTSRKAFEKYFFRLSSYGTPFWGTVTRLALERTQNQDGVDYARVVPVSSTRLSSQEISILRPFQATMSALLRPMQVEGEAESHPGTEQTEPEYDGGPR